MTDHPRTDRARAIVAELTAAGVRATADVRNANPPCVLVEPLPRVVPLTTMCRGAQDWTWRLVALAPGPGTLDAADTLDRLADAVLAVFPNATSIEPAAYQAPAAPDPLPAYILTMTE